MDSSGEGEGANDEEDDSMDDIISPSQPSQASTESPSTQRTSSPIRGQQSPTSPFLPVRKRGRAPSGAEASINVGQSLQQFRRHVMMKDEVVDRPTRVEVAIERAWADLARFVKELDPVVYLAVSSTLATKSEGSLVPQAVYWNSLPNDRLKKAYIARVISQQKEGGEVVKGG
ncbi:hypothetical protein LX36DRAFT_658505 [Colletotrichum falcatum]|nr:hypothetical protein LX36DRAFT_658505 [Colletotrichum falcatum]